MIEMQRGSLPLALARKIGAASPLPGEAGPDPHTRMDWALHWSRQGLHVFPCENYVGNPLIEKWHKLATTSAGQIAEFWSLFPDADIACVPDRSGHFAIGIIGPIGAASLRRIEEEHGKLDPTLSTINRWGNRYLVFSGTALSSHDELGRGVHVFGSGRYIFLPPSLTRIPEELSADQEEAFAHAR